MAQLGADVEALQRLARKFNDEARSVENSIAVIEAQLEQTWWQGPDANAFRDAWSSSFRPQLFKIAKALDDAHINMLRQAQQQTEASGG